MLARLVAAITAGEISDYMTGMRRKIILYAITGVLVLCGTGFLVAAGFIALERRIGGFYAAIWFAVGFFVLALLAFITVKISGAVRRKRAARRRGAEVRTLAGTAALALAPMLLSRSPLLVLAPLAAVLGYGIYRENTRPNRFDDPHDPLD